MFEAVFPFAAQPAEDVAALCLDTLGVDQSAHLRLYDERVERRALLGAVRRRQHFEIELGSQRLGWSGIRKRDLAFLTTDGTRTEDNLRLLSALGGSMQLIMARLYDAEYERWQNAEDPAQYAAARRSMEGLPMKSNKLPPPLEQMVVDTSRNPGRRVLRDGYVEAIGHRMWLGPAFFQRVPSVSRHAVLSVSWVKVTECMNGLIEISAQDAPFVDSKTADLQNRLRSLLFPTSSC